MFHFLISFRNKKAEALQSKIKQDLLCSIHPTYLFYYLFSRSELIKKQYFLCSLSHLKKQNS